MNKAIMVTGLCRTALFAALAVLGGCAATSKDGTASQSEPPQGWALGSGTRAAASMPAHIEDELRWILGRRLRDEETRENGARPESGKSPDPPSGANEGSVPPEPAAEPMTKGSILLKEKEVGTEGARRDTGRLALPQPISGCIDGLCGRGCSASPEDRPCSLQKPPLTRAPRLHGTATVTRDGERAGRSSKGA